MKSLLSDIGNYIVLKVYAQEPCAYVPGGCNPSDNPFESILVGVAEILVWSVSGLTLVFVMWGGFLMIGSLGDESKITQGRNSILYALGGFMLALSSQILISFVAAKGYIASAHSNPILGTIEGVVTAMTNVFNVVFVIVMVLTAFRLVIGRGKSEEFEAGKKMIIYAIIGAIVVNVSKSIVSATLNLF